VAVVLPPVRYQTPVNVLAGVTRVGAVVYWSTSVLRPSGSVTVAWVTPPVGGMADAHGRGQYGPAPRPTFQLLSRVASTGRVPTITATDRTNARADLAYWRTDLVVLGQHRHANALRATLNVLLGTGRPDSDVWIWNVQEA
jgi:hypothetical protein